MGLKLGHIFCPIKGLTFISPKYPNAQRVRVKKNYLLISLERLGGETFVDIFHRVRVPVYFRVLCVGVSTHSVVSRNISHAARREREKVSDPFIRSSGNYPSNSTNAWSRPQVPFLKSPPDVFPFHPCNFSPVRVYHAFWVSASLFNNALII